MCSIRSHYFASLFLFVYLFLHSPNFFFSVCNSIAANTYRNVWILCHEIQFAIRNTYTESTNNSGTDVDDDGDGGGGNGKSSSSIFTCLQWNSFYCSFIAVFPIRSFMLCYCCFFPVCLFVCLFASLRFDSIRFVPCRFVPYSFLSTNFSTNVSKWVFLVSEPSTDQIKYIAQNHVTTTKTQCNPILCAFFIVMSRVY